MPEINHKTAASTPAPAPAPIPAELAKASVDQQVAAAKAANPDFDLEAQFKEFLAKQRKQAIERSKPKEPNWATLTEKDAFDPGTYIPIIEHEIPDYMNIMLKDPEYVAIWSSKDQRRLGQLLAEGYEMLKPEHVDPKFKLPLLFDSEGLYCYMDVVAMRVHKRIIYSKRRLALDISKRQLARTHKPPVTKERFANGTEDDFDFGGLELYTPGA